MEPSLILHSISVILILWSIALLSYILGLPLSLKLLDVNQKENRKPYLFFYASIITGFTILNLAIFFATLIFDRGTDSVAIPTLILLLIISGIFLYYNKQILFDVIKQEYLKKLLLIALIPIASFHIILPILLGKWDMAYSTGDDASRWYMVVDYFRHNVFEYWKVTDVTLIWRLGERPLQNISGAIICSIFNTNQAIGYSLSSATAVIMTFLSFALLVETMFPFEKMKSRYLMWAVGIAFFGFYGVFTNVFYTGRTTHHFSIYPVIASLAFVAVHDKFYKRLVWFLFWNVSLAYYYSIRFSLNYLMIVFAIIGLQWIFRETKFKSLIQNAFALLISFAVAIFAAWGEVRAILDSMASESLEFLFMQRPGNYGSDGNIYDRFMKWSGFISTYEYAESIPKLIFLLKMGLVAFAIFLVLYKSIKSIKKTPVYFAIIFFNLAAAANLFLTENYYVAWKSALYWPIYMLIGITAIMIEYYEKPTVSKKMIGIGLAIFTFFFIALTVRQFDFYWGMTDQRFTKVDRTSYEMINIMSDYKNTKSNQNSQKKIFGYDYSAERHLLLREIFKDFDWQPVRDQNLNFLHDIVIKNPEQLDNYNYDFLLYANTYGKGEWIDISGNNNALIYDHFPFKIFTNKSSFIEFKKGIDIVHPEYDYENRCPKYEGNLTLDTCSIMFINNGFHNWLKLDFKIDSVQNVNINANYKIVVRDKIKESTFNNFKYDEKEKKYSITISPLNKSRLTELLLIRKDLSYKIYVSKVKWGY